MITITTSSSSSVKPRMRWAIVASLLQRNADRLGARLGCAARVDGRAAAGGAAACRHMAARPEAHRRGVRLVRADVGAGAGEAVVEVRQHDALVVARARGVELVVAAVPALPAMARLVDRRADGAVRLGARVGVDAAVAQVVVEVVGGGAGLHAD